MSKDISVLSDLQRSKRKYLSAIQYLKHIQKTGKIRLLTRSQINALRNRLARSLASIRRYLKLATLATGCCVINTIDLDAQCRMNRLPISKYSSFATFDDYISPVFADIDQDGDLDLIVGQLDGSISTYENRDGIFKRSYGLLNPFHGVDVGSFAAPTFIDFDGDGDADLFIGEYDGVVNFFRNDAGLFTPVFGAGNPCSGFDVGLNSAPTFVDIDSDGDADLFIGEINGTVNFYKNDAGSFTPVSGAGNPLNSVAAGSRAHPTFVDVDQDEDPDAFIGDGFGTIHFLRNDNGTFIPITGAGNPFNGVDVGGFAVPTFVDIDSDGDPDAFIGHYENTIHFFRNDNGVFSEVIVSDISFNGIDVGFDSAPIFADLDNDNDQDAFVGTGSGTIRSFINTNGIYNEVTGTNNPFNGIDVGFQAKPVLVDIDVTDSDTDLDLVIGNLDGQIRYYRNNNGTFALLQGPGNPFPGADVGTRAAPTFTDFDGDMDKDAFVGAGDGTIHYYRNDDGIFTHITGTANPFNGVDVGSNATPTIDQFAANRALVGSINGTIREFKKSGNQYVLIADSPFQGVDVGISAAPAIISGQKVVIGNQDGNIFVFQDQGGRSNVWQGPFTSNWHGPPSNWELMTIPKSGCDCVYVLSGSVLKVDPTKTAEGRTLTVKQGGQLEVKLGAELDIDPD